MILPNNEIERQYKTRTVIGADECGVGSLVGPVVSAAVVYDERLLSLSINDSKKLSAKKREVIYEALMNLEVEYAVGAASIDEIEKLNILNAAKLSMQRAIKMLQSPNCVTLIDGNRTIEVLDATVIPIVKGDTKSVTIAAASIIAKVTRDTIIQHMSSRYSGYKLEQNMGYATKYHIDALRRNGSTQYHRKCMLKKVLCYT
ncbi:Ribonuclease HII [Candidatus Fokinia solitaria]|uniref:Ribonuclease HII n=1 Tax=Candidatus Fokinia solitaria TaxID=1802984 RepID=A0A2U8BRI8_9RICK|nr:ribonuclease HII [Candidatus Fokinia solitaria]AWD32964.1 Ribonuclease HII [Candidatus Fokinia solitaria]